MKQEKKEKIYPLGCYSACRMKEKKKEKKHSYECYSFFLLVSTLSKYRITFSPFFRIIWNCEKL